MTVRGARPGRTARPISARGREPDAVEQREDRVVLVVEARQAGGAVELVGGADLVDAVEERELAQAVRRRRVVSVGVRVSASDDRRTAPTRFGGRTGLSVDGPRVGVARPGGS